MPDGRYRLTSFEDDRERMDPGRFLDADYAPLLLALVSKAVRQEAPIRDDQLVERIARAHGLKRSGRLIRDCILSAAASAFLVAEEEPGGATFVWTDRAARATWDQARSPDTQDDIRAIEDIALEELRASLSVAGHGQDCLADAARHFGIRRLMQQARARLERSMKPR